MKIINKKEFLKMPKGTVFCKSVGWGFNNVCIKEESIENDFFYIETNQFFARDPDEYFSRKDEMLQKGTSYPFADDLVSRDGEFNDNDVFLIFEKEDVKKLILLFRDAIQYDEAK